MPKPKPNESREDYVARCIPFVLDEGTAEDGKQAAAICNSLWEQSKKGEKSPHDRMLELIRERTEKRTEFNYGILTADRYVSTVRDAIGMQACYRHMCRIRGDWASFDDVVRKAAETLSYSNPDMQLKAKRREVELPSELERPKNTLMIFRHVLTTSRKDRDGDILRTKGAKLDPKMLLLWQHVHTLPIGKMIGVAGHTKDELQLYSCIVDMNELCHDSAVMVDNGMGRFSHGFRAIDFLEIKEGQHTSGGFDVKEFEILEESLVSVPANTDAVAEDVMLSLVEGGKLTSALMKDYGRSLRDRRPLSIPVNLDVKMTLNGEEVKSHENERGDEARGGEGDGACSPEEAETVLDEGQEEEKQTEVEEVKKKETEKPEQEEEKVECPECGEEVVPDADGNCPECGAKIEGLETEKGKPLWITLETMRTVCPDCADKMAGLGLKAVNVKQMPVHLLNSLCDKFGPDPGFFTRCSMSTFGGAVGDIEPFCAWLHHECLGTWPGEGEGKGEGSFEEKQLIDDSVSGGQEAAPPESDYERDGKMVCTECDYVGPGKDGKCPECGAKLVPRKDFVMEKLGRVLSKANETKIKEAIDDLDEAAKMDGVPRGCKALVRQAKTALSEVVASLGSSEGGVEKQAVEMDVKRAMAVLLASGGKKELRTMLSVLDAIEECGKQDEMVEQYVELFN